MKNFLIFLFFFFIKNEFLKNYQLKFSIDAEKNIAIN